MEKSHGSGRERAPRRTRVLFLAWGYSVHAERGIRPFAEDPEFEVAVFSNHEYAFAGAQNIPLTDAAGKKALVDGLLSREREEAEARQARGPAFRARRAGERAARAVRIARLLGRFGIRDVALLRRVLNSMHLVYEMELALRDGDILLRAAKVFRPEVVFLQTLLYPCYLAALLPRWVPQVVSFWNGDATWWDDWTGTDRLMKKAIVTTCARRAAAITVNSRAALEACRGYGIPEGRVHLVRYPQTDLARFTPLPREEARRALGIRARRVVLCPRGLGGYLNSDVIVEASPAVLARHPDTLFLFVSGVGRETELEGHRNRARQLGTAERFRWEGQVPPEAMPLYYGAADVMVSVSSRDSLPNCMLEAMACAVPVVMGDIPAIREWVEDGVTGFLVPPRSPEALAARIAEVFESPPSRLDAMGRGNLERVRREADSGQNVARVKEIVRQVAGAPAAGEDVALLPLPRTGIVSHILPPSPSGQATVLRRLLEGFPPHGFVLLSRERYDGAGGAADGGGKLPLPYFAFHPSLRLPSIGRFPGSSIRFAGDTLLEIRGRARQIGAIARAERLGLVVACSGDLVDLPASCLAARRAGIPFVPYLFDDYLYQWTGSMRTAARRMEPWVMRHVKDVIVPNEFLGDEYARRYGVRATVVRNPCPMPDLAALDAAARVFPPGGIDVVYAGAVYHAHYDAFRNLLAAIRMLGRADVRLHLYTAQTAEEIGRTGIAGPMVVHHPHISPAEVPAVLRQADILFLPLGFDTPIPEVIRTSAPGKTGEYLSVGRPILVHAPGDSFVSWYFRENRCGLVVDRSDPDLLSASIHRLFSDGDLRAGLGARARSAAEKDFEVGAVRARFFEALKAFAGGR